MSRAVIITSYIDDPVDISTLLQEGDTVICLDGGYDIAAEQGIKPDILLGDFDSIKAEIPDDGDVQVLKYPPEKDYSDLELALRLLDPRDYPEILIIGGIGGRQDQNAINMHLVTRYSRPDVKGIMLPPGIATTPDDYSSPFDRIDILDGKNHCFAVHGPIYNCCRTLDEMSAEYEDETASEPLPDSANDLLPQDFTEDESFTASSKGNDSQDNTFEDTDDLDESEAISAAEASVKPFTVDIPAEQDCYLSLVPMTDFCEGVTLTGVKYPLEDASLRRGSSLSISNEFDGESATLSILKGSLLVCISGK